MRTPGHICQAATPVWLVAAMAVLVSATITTAADVPGHAVAVALPSGAPGVEVEPPARSQVRLSTDGPTVAELIAAARAAARDTPGATPDAPVTVVLTADLAREAGTDRQLLGGLQQGHRAYVRSDVSWPERTIIHEVAHVLTDGDGHGELWRAVYLGAFEAVYGPVMASAERRRISRVYDHCHLDDSCPPLLLDAGEAGRSYPDRRHPAHESATGIPTESTRSEERPWQPSR